MCSTYMQGDMNSEISPDESTMPDDSKTLLFVFDTPLGFGVRPLQVDSLFPISRPHVFHLLHYTVHYAYFHSLFEANRDHVNN